MATATVNPALLLSGPGILYEAPLSTAEPSMTVASGKFPTAAWGGSWRALGSTDEGSEWTDEIETDEITVAESMYPVRIVTTGRTASWSTSLAEVNLSNLRAALNGGTTTVVSSVAGTEMSTLTPPTIGAETRRMIGWQSEDDTVRLIGYQVLQVGSLGVAFRKGSDKATLSLEWRFEKPTGDPYKIFLAGAARVA